MKLKLVGGPFDGRKYGLLAGKEQLTMVPPFALAFRIRIEGILLELRYESRCEEPNQTEIVEYDYKDQAL